MYPETLYPKTKQVLDKLRSDPILEPFYLAGGTALSLQLGHRKSIDLDFFSSNFPEIDILKQKLKDLDPTVIQEAPGTLDVLIDDVKVSFLEYKYKLLEDFVDFEGVKLAGVLDIACMKLSAMSSRGSKKDFVDLYKILQSISLQKLLDSFGDKFVGVSHQTSHLLKSLVHFDDAEADPEPDYIEKIAWSDVKTSISRDVLTFMNLSEV